MTLQTENIPTPPDARERLRAAALDQFTQRGYAATTIRELCQAAGVTKPVLYYYFKSKEGLYLDLMDGAYALFESTLAELTIYSGTPFQRIATFCEGVFDVGMSNLPLLRLIYSIYYGTPQGAPHYDLDQYFDRLLDVITALVREGIASNQITDGNLNDMTWAILSCLNTTLEEQLCHQQPRIDRSAMTRMLQLLFRGMAASHES
ncbi:MAG: TetR/AcrR family transcriptional regulator [Desulfuromonadales bacterium]|nr:TetR/AcrR family transcriptional regulator [Desulfuromonadales bacterium]